MSRPVSRGAIIAAILRKDLKAYSRERFIMFITGLGLLFLVGVFWILPRTVNETVFLGVHQTGLDAVIGEVMSQEEGLVVVWFDADEALRRAVETGAEDGGQELMIGLSFPPDFLYRVARGERTAVQVYVRSDVPAEVRNAMHSMAREIGHAIAGDELPITEPVQEEVVLGEDRVGRQVSLRERVKPMYAFWILMIETFGLAAIIASEIQSRTVTAILVSPAGVSDFLVAKLILGTALAFVEAAVLMAAIGSLGASPAILLVALLLGAVMVTAVGLIAGARGTDFVDVVFWSILLLLPLAVPPVASLFPGTASVWVRVLPSYGLVESVMGVIAYGEGWGDVLPRLGLLLAWDVILVAVGLFILKRKVEAL